jgi:hypothetical protein
MYRKLFWIRFLGLIAAAALLAACAPVPSNPTVTASANDCTYSGPKSLPSTFTITWAVKHTAPSMDYMFIISTLAEGKSTADFKPYIGSEAEAPDWIHFVRYTGMVNETQTQSFDLTANAEYHGEPIYVICTARTIPVGIVGPIEVKESD